MCETAFEIATAWALLAYPPNTSKANTGNQMLSSADLFPCLCHLKTYNS